MVVSFPLPMVSFEDDFSFFHFPLRHPHSPKPLLSPLLFSVLTFPRGPPTSLASIPTNASDAPILPSQPDLWVEPPPMQTCLLDGAS